MWQGTLRNVLPDGSLQDYIRVVQRTFGAKLTPDDVYAADLLSALGAIDTGVTCVLDWSHIQNSPEHTDACIKGLVDSGIRAVFAYGAGQNETGGLGRASGQSAAESASRLSSGGSAGENSVPSASTIDFTDSCVTGHSPV